MPTNQRQDEENKRKNAPSPKGGGTPPDQGQPPDHQALAHMRANNLSNVSFSIPLNAQIVFLQRKPCAPQDLSKPLSMASAENLLILICPSTRFHAILA